MVDDETCETIMYEGYVQPACEEEASAVGQIPFAVSFVPSPACKKYTVTCDSSGVESNTIDDAGSGYTNGAYPGLPYIGGGGSGATADVTVAGGIITVAAVATPGSGYTSTPVLDISSIPFTPGTNLVLTTTMVGCTDLIMQDCVGEIFKV